MIYSFNGYGEMIESHQEVKQISEPAATDPVIEEKPVSIAANEIAEDLITYRREEM